MKTTTVLFRNHHSYHLDIEFTYLPPVVDTFDDGHQVEALPAEVVIDNASEIYTGEQFILSPSETAKLEAELLPRCKNIL